jgi:hypothetical protein
MFSGSFRPGRVAGKRADKMSVYLKQTFSGGKRRLTAPNVRRNRPRKPFLVPGQCDISILSVRVSTQRISQLDFRIR